MWRERLFVESLRDITPDDAGIGISDIKRIYGVPQERIVFLSRNENPYGPSPEVLKAISNVELNRYPSHEDFLNAAAGYLGVSEEHIILGAGLDGVIDSVARLFLEKGRTAFILIPTYTYYELAARLCGSKVVLSTKFDRISADASLIFLCSPNNPTGSVIEREVLRALLDRTDSIVFLDEAYAEFAGESYVRWVERYDNLIVGRTLSKAFGLAGLRIGYAVAPEWIAQQYRRAAPAFGISAPALAGGIAALNDLTHMKRSVEKIVSERDRISRILKTDPSHANFIYIKTSKESSMLVEDLLKEGIAVKDCSAIPGADKYHIRVTIGTQEQNDIFLEAYTRLDSIG